MHVRSPMCSFPSWKSFCVSYQSEATTQYWNSNKLTFKLWADWWHWREENEKYRLALLCLVEMAWIMQNENCRFCWLQVEWRCLTGSENKTQHFRMEYRKQSDGASESKRERERRLVKKYIRLLEKSAKQPGQSNSGFDVCTQQKHGNGGFPRHEQHNALFVYFIH